MTFGPIFDNSHHRSRSPISFLPREEIENKFLGKLCEIIQKDAQQFAITNHVTLIPVFKRDASYKPSHILNPNQNWIDEQKYEKNWWSKGSVSVLLKARDFFLVVDIVRNNDPGWSAVVLLEKNTYLVRIEDLLLKEE